MINLQAFKESKVYQGDSSNYEPRAPSSLLLKLKAPT